MHFSTLTTTTLAVLTGSAVAKKCINATVPVTISARQGVFSLDLPTTNLETTDFIANMTQQGRNFTELALMGYATTAGTYNISTQFCTPSNKTSAKPTVQVLTHGIGFDKTYWDLSFNNYNYSYINTATDGYGYCTLSFDRLGLGNSSHGEPLNEIQSFIEVAATVELTKMLRAGQFPGVNTTFGKVVHVGHSFGSAQTYALANQYPNITDGIVLTGFSMNSSYTTDFLAGGNFQQAYMNQPFRFSNISGVEAQTLLNLYAQPLTDLLAPLDLSKLAPSVPVPKGYLVSSNIEANKYLFLKPKYFDPAILQLAEQTKQPVTEGELLTLGSLAMVNNYAGPVMVIDGDADLPYCGGNCSATGGVASSLGAMVSMNFPNVAAANFSSHVQPNTGHGLNLHYNATAGYNVIQEFLASKNLQSA